jgi:hypothetical protein
METQKGRLDLSGLDYYILWPNSEECHPPAAGQVPKDTRAVPPEAAVYYAVDKARSSGAS